MKWTDLTLVGQMQKILRAQQDPLYFFSDPFFMGDNLWPSQKEIITQFYNNKYRMLVICAGQRSSKTFLLSRFAAYETFLVLTSDYPAKYNLAKGSPYFISLVAASEEQITDTVWHHLKYKLQESPFFQFHQPKIVSDSVEFATKPNFFIRLLSSYSTTAAGRTNKAVLIDEVTGLEETTGKRGAWTLFNTLHKSIRTFGQDGHMFVVGTPKHPQDILMQLIEFASRHEGVLALRKPTWEMNPNIKREDLSEEFTLDPQAAWRDYGAEPRLATDTFLHDPGIVDYEFDKPNLLQMIADGIPVPETIKGTFYVLAGDPSLKHDAFGIALAHEEDGYYFIDGIYRFKPQPEINPLEVKQFILKVCRELPVTAVVFDTWHYAGLQEELKQMGVQVFNHVVKSDDYQLWKRLCYEKKVSHVYYPPFKQEIESLIIKQSKIDHPLGGSKDCADAVMNCLWLLTQKVAKPVVPVVLEVF